MNAALQLATYADLLKLPQHCIGEILDGQLHVQPRPAIRHVRSCTRLVSRLGSRFDQDGSDGSSADWVILAEPELHLAAHVVVPDLAGWRRSRLANVPADALWLDITPDWVCEILSPSTARVDRSVKMRIYAEQGVGFLWLVDPVAQTLEAYLLSAGRWTVLGTWGGDEHVGIPPFEALELALLELWVM